MHSLPFPFAGGRLIRRDSDEPRVNQRIRIPEIRLIDENGAQVGIIATSVAMEMAQERGLDLVEVSPASRPPVCRIMDFGKYKYEQSKKAKEARKKQHTVVIKEVQFRPKTDDHDYGFKLRNIIRFLEHKDKVKITLRFRGREMSHMDFAMQTFDRLTADLADHGKIEQEPKQEGRTVVMIMAPLSDRERRPARPREESPAPSAQE